MFNVGLVSAPPAAAAPVQSYPLRRGHLQHDLGSEEAGDGSSLDRSVGMPRRASSRREMSAADDCAARRAASPETPPGAPSGCRDAPRTPQAAEGAPHPPQSRVRHAAARCAGISCRGAAQRYLAEGAVSGPTRRSGGRHSAPSHDRDGSVKHQPTGPRRRTAGW